MLKNKQSANDSVRLRLFLLFLLGSRIVLLYQSDLRTEYSHLSEFLVKYEEEVEVKIPATQNTTYDYDDIYNSMGTHSSYSDRRIFNFTSFDNYSSSDILRSGCPLTVVVVDPRTPNSGFNHPMWYALESLAMFVPHACVVLHTASCQIIKHLRGEPTNQQKVHVVAKTIYERSLPQFRRMMEYGQVRINIIDTHKYGLENCDSFGVGNNIFMNVGFWKDEFIDELDSDMVLTFQDDAVICRPFDVDLWKHYAYVGAPWIPEWFFTNNGKGGMGCDSMRDFWSEWAPKCNGLNEYQINESMSHLCTPGFGGLQGNGGVSLRNRSWMIEVILRCPSEFSGLQNFQEFHANEDVYFSTVLNGLNATMPSAFEASLFSVENLFPEETFKHFNLEKHEILAAVKRLWGNETGAVLYERMHRRDSYPENILELRTMPVFFHKPWTIRDVVHDVQIQNECKMLKFVARR